MTTATTEPTATLTLPVWTLQSLRVRALATAALVTLDLIGREAYWASEAGRCRSASMWCGEQDAVSMSLDALRERIDAERATADALAAAITAAGFGVITPGAFGVVERVCGTALLILDLPSTVISQANATQCNDWADDLRDYLTGRI